MIPSHFWRRNLSQQAPWYLWRVSDSSSAAAEQVTVGPLHRLLSAGSFGTSKPCLATWAQPVSQRAVDTAGLCPSHCSARDPHPLLGAVPHALTPCFSPFPDSRLYYCSHSSAPHRLVFGCDSSSPASCHPVTLCVFLIFAKYQPRHDQTKGLSQEPCALHFTSNLR